MSSFGLIEENIDLSHIHLAVPKFKTQISLKDTKIQSAYFHSCHMAGHKKELKLSMEQLNI